MLYNLYRPSDFSEVKGQEDVLLTLKKQAAGGRFGHAYLLAGHRGTGKTTIARILSKAVNCEHPTEIGPCKACESCLAAKDSMDIIELDAASNNGVDKIKEMMAQTKYRPVQMKNKVFIIDEVHNLSKAAFDVLLKPLEEPPSYCTFILCTTELHKIPVTVKSRCETYQFHPIDAAPMRERLKEVLAAQNATCEEDALNLIVRSANGGLRDALGLLEQLMVSCNMHITGEAAKRRLGMLDTERIVSCLESCMNGNTPNAISSLDELLSCGKTPSLIIDTALQVLTDIITMKSTGSKESVLHSHDYLDRLYEIAAAVTFERLYWLCGQFCDTRSALRTSIDGALDIRLLFILASNREIISCDPVELAEEVSLLKKEVNDLKLRLAQGAVIRPETVLAGSCKQEESPSAPVSVPEPEEDGFLDAPEGAVPFAWNEETDSNGEDQNGAGEGFTAEDAPEPLIKQADDTQSGAPKEGGMQPDRTETEPSPQEPPAQDQFDISASDLFKIFR